MGSLPPVLDVVSQDPVLAYSLLAAALLAVVSLVTGLARLDVLALVRPRTLLRVAGAVAVAFLMTLLASVLAGTGAPQPITGMVAGSARFPLYLVTLAYGPSAGLLAGALFAGFAAGTHLPGWPEAIVTLELVVLGWLAIYPSPRSSRWSGPFDAVLAYALAWGTAGLALQEATLGTVTAAGVLAQHRGAWAGVAVSALLLALVRPETYSRAFPFSRIAPPAAAPADAAPPGLELTPSPAARHEPPLPERAARRSPTLTHPELPRAVARGRRRRELEPLPWPAEED